MFNTDYNIPNYNMKPYQQNYLDNEYGDHMYSNNFTTQIQKSHDIRTRIPSHKNASNYNQEQFISYHIPNNNEKFYQKSNSNINKYDDGHKDLNMDKISIKEGLKKNVAEQAYKSKSYFEKFYQKGNSNINKYDDGANYLNKKEVHQDLSMDKINIKEGLKNNLVEQAAETNSDFKKELLKVFIYIYFYEKIVTEDNNFFINSKEKYYLINPGWLNKFKEVYSYTQIKKNIESIKISLNYNEIDSMIETIIKLLSITTMINIVALDEDLKVLNTINTSVQRKNNVLFTNEGVILPSKIMNITAII